MPVAAARRWFACIHDYFLEVVFVFIEDFFLLFGVVIVGVRQYGRSFEVAEIPWRDWGRNSRGPKARRSTASVGSSFHRRRRWCLHLYMRIPGGKSGSSPRFVLLGGAGRLGE
jgi:hypothetical protein